MKQLVHNIEANQLLEVKEQYEYGDSTISSPNEDQALATRLEKTNITFRHHENKSTDFKIQPLLPRAYSTEGPAFALGDVNKDGNEDIFVGAAKEFLRSGFKIKIGSSENQQ